MCKLHSGVCMGFGLSSDFKVCVGWSLGLPVILVLWVGW